MAFGVSAVFSCVFSVSPATFSLTCSCADELLALEESLDVTLCAPIQAPSENVTMNRANTSAAMLDTRAFNAVPSIFIWRLLALVTVTTQDSDAEGRPARKVRKAS